MKKAFVTQRLITNPDYFEIREALDIRLAEFLLKSDILSIPLSYSVAPKNYFNIIQPDIIILSGGNDLSCVNPTDELSIKRDLYERSLLKEAIVRKIKVLGICRGMQFLLSENGIKLQKVENHVENHPIKMDPKGFFKLIYGNDYTVNSYHQWGPLTLPSSFQSEAIAADGVLEAFSEPNSALTGIMWHPERNNPFDESDIQLMKYILKGNL